MAAHTSSGLRELSAGSQIDTGEGVGAVLTEALDAPPEEWEGVLKARLLADDAVCTADEMIGVLQDKMGEVVLGMPAGSSVQSVIAEYLNELIGRAREVAAAEQ